MKIFSKNYIPEVVKQAVNISIYNAPLVLKKTATCTLDSRKDQRLGVGGSGRWNAIGGESA